MRIDGTSGRDRLSGTAEQDLIYGYEGSDVIYSNGGADTIYGGSGGDVIYLRASGATAYGEDGKDTFVVEFSEGSRQLSKADGGSGTNEISIAAFTPRYDGFVLNWYYVSGAIRVADVEARNISILRGTSDSRNSFNLIGAHAGLTVHGGQLDDSFFSPSGPSVLYGHAGSDSFNIRSSDTVAYGGDGNDSFGIDASFINVTVDGGDGSDFFEGTSGIIDLEAGTYVSLDGESKLISIENAGLYGAGKIYGTSATNFLSASLSFFGEGEPPVQLYGRDGADFLEGGSSSDRLDGGAGDDSIIAGIDDFVFGGDGVDSVDFSVVQGGVVVVLDKRGSGTATFANGGRVMLFDIENVAGTLGGTVDITGNVYSNSLTGSYEADKLNGFKGDDILLGGLGEDILTGGDGADVYVYRYAIDSGYLGEDTITDFSRRSGDKIALDFDANSALADDQDFLFIKNRSFTNVAGQLRYEIIDQVTVIMADTDGDAISDFTINLAGQINIKATDFIF